MKNKKAAILVENVIFIILNLIFLSLLIFFIARQGGGVILLEQSYAKQIALVFDSAKPGMTIFVDFEKGIEKIKSNFDESYYKDVDKFKSTILNFKDNIVTVKLKGGDRLGYSYSFFNDIDLNNINYYVNEEMGGIYFIF